MNLIDLDGHEQLDIAGSYGVNVAGYDRYKKWISEGWNEVLLLVARVMRV